ncbi:mycofactocin-coupled SDR family oxidoreductase [Amycolatopsis sp. GM8]|uniref:mycofactocin-coupled SDR family oxidoreductase n=1 Tax=Amycolatopsis sp. GM8 TaxID=2896530 RepID=UPI001F2E6F31|nr:mycofactocin-coupled SDR family oxidoreductase [Amycolatopsis sp. GM8]
MTRRFEGKTVLITGAARGQGRSHAIRVAEEGGNVIAVDACAQVATVAYPMSSRADLAQTVELVQRAGGKIAAAEADVRDFDGLCCAVEDAVADFGGLHGVVANAGICSHSPLAELGEQAWQDVLDINLTGVWHTCKAAIPHLRRSGAGGSIVMTNSTVGLRGVANVGHYVAAKHGLIGLMRTFALELAPESIRVNSVNPTTVNTEMINNESTFRLFRPDLATPTLDDARDRFASANALPVPWVESSDVSDAVLFLLSEQARFITGTALPVDAGATIA